MSCCGTPKQYGVDAQQQQNQRDLLASPAPPTMVIGQQPLAHPGAAYPLSPSPNAGTFQNEFGGANVSPPPNVYSPNGSMGYQINGNGMNQQFSPNPTHSLPPSTNYPSLGPNVVKPLPVYPQNNNSGMGSMITREGSSPGFTAPITVTSLTSVPSNSGYDMNSVNRAQMPSPGRQAQPREGRMSVAIDFGTTFSGVAYGSSRIAGGKIQQILNWPGSTETFRKIPTALLYDETGNVAAWGLEAKNRTPTPGQTKCEWFKLFLEPKVLRDPTLIDKRLPSLPPGKGALDVIIDFLSCLWEYAKQQITRELGIVADLDSADVWLTVPAAWDAKGCEIMREAAITAGLVQAARAGEKDWRDRLHITTEPEAAAVHCAHLTELHHLLPSQTFMICDAGGGTVDLAAYKVIGILQQAEIAEIAARSGANCGSLFLDLRFKQLVQTLLERHPIHLDPVSMVNFVQAFSETEKAAFRGPEDDRTFFHFNCFNTEDADDPEVGLVNGELAIPGKLLREFVFDPVVDEVLKLLEDQVNNIGTQIDALLMVGGFSASEYLFKRVDERFRNRIKLIARPPDADTATLRGAAQHGLSGNGVVSSVVVPRAYIMKVKLPATEEDWQKRPAYIKQNDVGLSICENRLMYLVAKGAIMRKGQRVENSFCKYSTNPQDRIFEATLYTSDSDRIYRYTDEGAIRELCKWTVDVGVLPSFQQQVNMPSSSSGFYTEFKLGLSVDSAEVRGVLMDGVHVIGDVVFDFRS